MKLRFARPTDNLERITQMYTDGLGLTVLAHFEDHDGFNGAILGLEGHEWHLEFTQHPDIAAGRAPTEEHLLVLYLPDAGEWETRCDAMLAAGFEQVESNNPYWDVAGRTFEDTDGYRVVLQNRAWEG